MHLNNHSPAYENALFGEGSVDWQRIFGICKQEGSPTEWHIVEQERYPVPPMESVQRCLEALRGKGKA